MSIRKDTIVRTVLLLLAITNNFLALFGKSPLPFDDDQVTEVVSFVFTAVIAWYKNNSFTLAARKADAYLAELRKKGGD